MREFARSFYSSITWQNCRATYLKSVGHICERCFSFGIFTPATVVHHVIHLSPENINDPNVTLNFDNLRALCVDCHAAVHRPEAERRYTVDELGHVKV